jgi:hypothetical protein
VKLKVFDNKVALGEAAALQVAASLRRAIVERGAARIIVYRPRNAMACVLTPIAGFKGVKMHRPKYNWDDFGYFPIYGEVLAKILGIKVRA